MNREEKINSIVHAYMDSIMCVNLEDWIEDVLRYGRSEKGLDNLTDEELDEQYQEWVGELNEEDK